MRLSKILMLPLLLGLAACQTTQSGKAPSGGAPQGKPQESVSFQHSRLQGQDAAGLNSLLGEPALVRREAEVEIWQYQHESCVLDLFLYPDGSSRRVIHLEARDTEAAEALPPQGCLDRVLTARAARAAV